MCRLTAYLGKPILAADLVTRPSRSVIRQSFDARERAGGSGSNVYEIGALNADGFGLGWYADSDDNDTSPCVYTEVGPAWNNRNLNRLARKISSNCIFAHVRAAGPGMGVCECSCHPFQSGRFLFMHNGNIGGFETIRRSILASLKDFSFNYAISNSCSDTALAFAVFLDQLEEPNEQVSASRLKEMMVSTIRILCDFLDQHDIQETSLLNFVVTDGSSMAATRYSRSVVGTINSCSLYFAAGSTFEVDKTNLGPKSPSVDASGDSAHAHSSHIEAIQEYRMSHSDGHTGVAIITSEPLTNARADWVPVPENHIIIATSDNQVLLSPLANEHFECLGASDAIRECHDALEMLGQDELPQPVGSSRHLDGAGANQLALASLHGSKLSCSSGSCGHGSSPASFDPLTHALSHTTTAKKQMSSPLQPSHDVPSPLHTTTPAGVAAAVLSPEAVANSAGHLVSSSDFVLSLNVEGTGAKVTSLPGAKTGNVAASASSAAEIPVTLAVTGGLRSPTNSRRQREMSLSAIVVSKKLNLIFTADANAKGRIHIWDVNMWSLLSTAKNFDSCIMCLCVDDEHSLLYSSCSDNVVYVHDISQVKEHGIMNCMLSFAVPNIGHILSLSVMYLNFGVTLLLLGSQDGNVRRICLNSSLCLSGQQQRQRGLGQRENEQSAPLWQLVDDELKTCDEEKWASRGTLCQSPPRGTNCASATAVKDAKQPAAGEVQSPAKDDAERYQQSLIECSLVPNESQADQSLGWAKKPSTTCSAGGLSKRGLNVARASHCGFVFTLAVADGFICSGGGEGFIKLWSTNSLGHLHNLRGHRGEVIGLQVDRRSNTLFSASADRTVRVWDLDTISCRRTLPCSTGGITCMCICIPNKQDGGDPFSAAGPDLQPHLTGASVLTPSKAGDPARAASSWPKDKLQLDSSCRDGYLAVGSDAGYVHVFALNTLEEVLLFRANPDAAMSALGPHRLTRPNCLTYHADRNLLFCGCVDGNVLAWKLRQPSNSAEPTTVDSNLSDTVSATKPKAGSDSETDATTHDTVPTSSSHRSRLDFNDSFFHRSENMIHVLRDFVAIKTVSSSTKHKEECWRGAKFVATLLEQAGCRVKQCASHKQDLEIAPVVIGFLPRNGAVAATEEEESTSKSIVIFGHYDVVAAGDARSWNSDPWTLAIKNGYIYGRGVTDDKGPLVAAIFAAAKLKREEKLNVDIVFLIEGAEESGIGMGARGLDRVVADNRHWFRNPSAILISNNYWIDDHTPCLTYGMRGVIDLEVQIQGAQRNLHAGFDGGVIVEPLSDLLGLLASLHTADGSIAVEGLTKGVRELTDDERERFKAVSLNAKSYEKSLGVSLRSDDPTEILQSRWGEPVLSVCCVTSSNSSRMFRTIPHRANGRISLHYVPNQRSSELVAALKEHLTQKFAERSSPNTMDIVIKQVSHWWYTDPRGAIFQRLGNAIADVWGQAPALIREGGSYGGITRHLEEKLQAPAIHFPMGQATDNAHLPNERLRLHNLTQGHDVLYRFFQMQAE